MMLLTKISVSVSAMVPLVCVSERTVSTLTLMALVILPVESIVSSGLWPEKM